MKLTRCYRWYLPSLLDFGLKFAKACHEPHCSSYATIVSSLHCWRKLYVISTVDRCMPFGLATAFIVLIEFLSEHATNLHLECPIHVMPVIQLAEVCLVNSVNRSPSRRKRHLVSTKIRRSTGTIEAFIQFSLITVETFLHNVSDCVFLPLPCKCWVSREAKLLPLEISLCLTSRWTLKICLWGELYGRQGQYRRFDRIDSLPSSSNSVSSSRHA